MKKLLKPRSVPLLRGAGRDHGHAPLREIRTPSRTAIDKFLNEGMMFGGELWRRGDVIKYLERLGGTPAMIGIYVLGLLPIRNRTSANPGSAVQPQATHGIENGRPFKADSPDDE